MSLLRRKRESPVVFPQVTGKAPCCPHLYDPSLMLLFPVPKQNPRLDKAVTHPPQRRGLIFQPVKSDRRPDLIAAFSSAENATKFIVSWGETE